MAIRHFRRKSDPRLAPVTWQQKLDLADSEDEVVGVVRDYVATLDPGEVALLPAALRPGKMLVANDVASYALDLVRYDCDETHGVAVLVHRLAAFFSHASIRLSEILRRTNDDDDASRETA